MIFKQSKIAFIGAGKAGLSIGRHFIKKGGFVCGFYDVNFNAANTRGLNKFVSLEELAEQADIIFITVPDNQINHAWRELKKYPLKNKIICHASGVLTSQIFKNINKTGAFAFSAHPLYAINGVNTPLENISFAVEGSADKIEFMQKFFKAAGNPAIIINPKDKILYHAACVFASNLTSALIQTAADLFKKSNIPPAAWQKLFIDNALNAINKGLIKSLTGPVERGDADSVHKHINALKGDCRNIYINLSKILLRAAKAKNPQRDYNAVEKELK
ncbi:MAG: DUF2520 domain-containing protein [Elusimicrobiota bacterium]|jgi:predicted short-subunit dehydrogenase-like oxidoreductase (DUF2520 family)|nr:DUF2520 domain-containing protein [Elusimicrobiota bacterium]